MEYDEYLAFLRGDAARMLDLASRDELLTLPVPACDGWTVREVLLHTADVYRDKVACMRLQRDPGQWPPPGGSPDDPTGSLRAALDELLGELESRGPEAPSYTWFGPDQTVGFWCRRMAHETAVHRVDVETAAGVVTPVDADLALDGIDEVLNVMLAGDWSDVPTEEWGDVDPRAGTGRAVAVRSGDRAWRIALAPNRTEVTAATGPADATVTGDPSELALWLWGRRPRSAVTVRGEVAAVEALRTRLLVATQ